LTASATPASIPFSTLNHPIETLQIHIVCNASWLPSRTPRTSPPPLACSYPSIQPSNPGSNQSRRRTFTLSTGDKIPAIGLGTWQSKPNEVSKAVETALRAGYRHIDTAAAYGNEKEVGEGIKASGVPRDQIWVTTKLNNPDHKRVSEAIADSLANLGTDYVDLYLIHWPASTVPGEKKIYEDWDYVDTWREMQKLVDTGKVRNIGVSNFAIQHLDRLLSHESCKVCSFLFYSSS
jgi:glycerol 2-dehydrogenase (NADP+)